MKIFYKKISLFFFAGVLAINLFGYLIFKLHKFEGLTENNHIYTSIFKSQRTHKNTKTYIFGDSVGNQMYFCQDYNDTINSLCTVMPLTLAGQYLLIKSICHNNEMKNKKVVLLLSPQALKSEFDDYYSFHYFLKPFYNSNYLGNFDDYLNKKIKAPKFAWLSQIPMVKISNYSNETRRIKLFNNSKKFNEYYSETTRHYLEQIDSLSQQYHFNIAILPTIQNKNKISQLKSMQQEIEQSSFAHLFDNYFGNIIYWDANRFKNDGTHFKERKLSTHNILNL